MEKRERSQGRDIHQGERDKKDMKCYRCNNYGHLGYECTKLKEKNKKEESLLAYYSDEDATLLRRQVKKVEDSPWTTAARSAPLPSCISTAREHPSCTCGRMVSLSAELPFPDNVLAAEITNEVNLWAHQQTNGLIKEILPAGAVDDTTRLIFANAVYFKGAWNEKFDPSKTKDYDFHLLDGSKVQVPFMTSKKKQFVCEYDGFKVLRLPYSQGEDERHFTMYFFLPNEKDGLPQLIRKIGSESDFLDHHTPHRKTEVGQFLIPKFKMSFGFEASDMLKELGLVLPFTGKEGLNEMVDNPSVGQNLYVSSIHHKSFIGGKARGTEAAAVTAGVVMLMSLRRPDVKVDFVADHPFFFVIREDISGVA
ncbi:protease inhibitor I4, serpin, conserved site-containing protein [Tanacetum coccineum]